MSERLQTRVEPVRATQFAHTDGLLHCKYACGGSTPEVECEECRKSEALQRCTAGSGVPSGIPPIVHEVLRSSGQQLDTRTRGFLEPRFRHDCSKVRIHADSRAAESANAVNALAYTVGNHIVFGAGQYAPQEIERTKLVTHEITHVIQQTAGVGPDGYPQMAEASHLRMCPADDALEREAERTASIVLSAPSELSPRLQSPTLVVQRAPWDEGPLMGSALEDHHPLGGHRSTLPYREATELLKCVEVMGEKNQEYCRQQVLGEKPEKKTESGPCCCCAEKLEIYDPFVYESPADPLQPYALAGHIFTTKMRLSYKGAAPKKSCSLQWWEKTDQPYILVPQPNTWTNLAGNPSAKSISDWNTKRKEPCPGEDVFQMVDSPALALVPSRMNTSRTLEFRIAVNSGRDCSVCGDGSKQVTAKQFLKIANGKLDKAASYFKSPNPDDTGWK